MKVSWPIAAGALALSAPAYAASDSETGATIVAFIFLVILYRQSLPSGVITRAEWRS
jgi:hypothetical protein